MANMIFMARTHANISLSSTYTMKEIVKNAFKLKVLRQFLHARFLFLWSIKSFLFFMQTVSKNCMDFLAVVDKVGTARVHDHLI